MSRVDAVAPVDAFLTDFDHWAVDKTDYDALLKVALELEHELAEARSLLKARGQSPDNATAK